MEGKDYVVLDWNKRAPDPEAQRYPKGSVVPEWNHYCADGHEPVASLGDRCPVCRRDVDGNIRPDPEAQAMREVVEEAKSVVQRAGRRPDGTAWANLNINDLAAKVEALRAQEKR